MLCLKTNMLCNLSFHISITKEKNTQHIQVAGFHIFSWKLAFFSKVILAFCSIMSGGVNIKLIIWLHSIALLQFGDAGSLFSMLSDSLVVMVSRYI